jgi:hypothetical protein
MIPCRSCQRALEVAHDPLATIMGMARSSRNVKFSVCWTVIVSKCQHCGTLPELSSLAELVPEDLLLALGSRAMQRRRKPLSSKKAKEMALSRHGSKVSPRE